MKKLARRYTLALLVLIGLFAFRVVAQLIQAWYPVEFLPAFERWHSGVLPYGLLVGVQGVILVACLRIVWGIFKRTISPSRKKWKILFALGIIYLLGMSTRLIVGLTIAPDHYWSGAIMPTVFHLVLASFVVLYGRFHSMASRESVESQKVAPA
jgi:hypothetical protein